jgi:hypothetical protein
MPKKLTETDKFFIEKNPEMSIEELQKVIKGVRRVDIEDFRETLFPATSPNDTPEQQTTRLRASQARAGTLMVRNREKGITMMTEAASEISDINRPIRLADSAEKKKGKLNDVIHRPLD